MNVKQYSSATFLWIYGDMWDYESEVECNGDICYCNILIDVADFILLSICASILLQLGLILIVQRV